MIDFILLVFVLAVFAFGNWTGVKFGNLKQTLAALKTWLAGSSK
jgi:hypothetical protein